MMIELYPRLFVRDQESCLGGFDGLAVVHACNSPCHEQAVGYRGTLPPERPYYLSFEDAHNQYLNLIGPPAPGRAWPRPYRTINRSGGFHRCCS
jgi:hypothetical protein